MALLSTDFEVFARLDDLVIKDKGELIFDG